MSNGPKNIWGRKSSYMHKYTIIYISGTWLAMGVFHCNYVAVVTVGDIDFTQRDDLIDWLHLRNGKNCLLFDWIC